jgi:hypothetical protein
MSDTTDRDGAAQRRGKLGRACAPALHPEGILLDVESDAFKRPVQLIADGVGVRFTPVWESTAQGKTLRQEAAQIIGDRTVKNHPGRAPTLGHPRAGLDDHNPATPSPVPSCIPALLVAPSRCPARLVVLS